MVGEVTSAGHFRHTHGALALCHLMRQLLPAGARATDAAFSESCLAKQDA